MIEQIMGSGSSGIAEQSGKAAKQTASGPFAKLIAILGKQGKTTAKPPLPAHSKAQNTPHSQHAPLIKQKLSQKIILSQSGKAVTAEKKAAKHIDNNNGSTSQAVVLQIMTQTFSPTVKLAGGKLIIHQPVTGKQGRAQLAAGRQADAQLAAGKQADAQLAAGKQADVQLAADRKLVNPQSAGSKNSALQFPANQLKGVLLATQSLAAKQHPPTLHISAGKADIADAGKPVKGKGKASFAAAAKNQSTQNITTVIQQPSSPEQEKTGTVSASPTEPGRAATLTHPLAKGETAKQFNDAKLKSGTDRLTLLAAHNATPQQHVASTSNQSSSISAVIQSAARHSAPGDTGRQSTDKGNQDASQMFSVYGKSSTASVSASNFQQYLSHKPTPVMTMFDSIQYIAQAAKNGHSKLEIQLDPAHLGKMTISLQVDASKHLQVHMIVDQSTTRAAVDQQLPALRHALAQQGLDLSGFSMGSQGGQNSSDFEHKESFGSFRQTDIRTEIETPSTATTHQPAMHAGSGLSIHI